MVPTLQQLCCQEITKLKITDLETKTTQICYNKVVGEHIKEGYEFWKQDMKLIN